jgi:hypothetical protein
MMGFTNCPNPSPPANSMKNGPLSLQSSLDLLGQAESEVRFDLFKELDCLSALASMPEVEAHRWNKKFSELLGCRADHLSKEVKVAREEARSRFLPAAAAEEEKCQADLLIDLAHEFFTFGCDQNGNGFALPKEGPAIIRPIGGGKQGFRTELALRFHRENKAPSGSALASALEVLTGYAKTARRQQVYVRVAKADENYWLDLGNSEGLSVRYSANGWALTTTREVLFRRSELTGALPTPIRGGDLSELKDLLQLREDTWPLLLGWLVASLLPWVPHPVLFLNGLQGSGKSTVGRMIAGLVDPKPAPLVPPPANEREWALHASAAWVLAVDNISKVDPWWSDALCRAATGGGHVHRKLFTNEELTVLVFQRPIILTSIDAGAFRGDLADRLLCIELPEIREKDRQYAGELEDAFKEMHPSLLGALLTLTTEVLKALPGIALSSKSRMADFERVLAALDQVAGTNSRQRFREMREEMAISVIESDPLGNAIVSFAEREDSWSGTFKDLLSFLPRPPGSWKADEWPTSPRGLSAQVRRLAPALHSAGVDVQLPSAFSRGKTRKRERLLTITWLRREPEATQETVQPSRPGAGGWQPGRQGNQATLSVAEHMDDLDGSDGWERGLGLGEDHDWSKGSHERTTGKES